MSLLVTLVTLFSLLLPTLPAMQSSPDEPVADTCRYPATQERFSLTVTGGQEIHWYDVSLLKASGYLDWWYSDDARQPDAMHYFPMVYTSLGLAGLDKGRVQQIADKLPGALWLMGNESENIWQDPSFPEDYARNYHEIREYIKSVDPTARFAFTGITMVTPLRMEWLNRVWTTYRNLYGVDMPVDVWNVHTFNLNEMANDWGADLPLGIPNAVGYKGNWSQEQDSGASGGNVHKSNQNGAFAKFGFQGNQVTVYLRKGPDGGTAKIYLDNESEPSSQVNLNSDSRGTVTRTFSNLQPPDDFSNRHHVRIQVDGSKWVRVDAIQASSTGSLPGGRLENDSPYRARLLDIQEHDRLDLVKEQVRTFRQWMADHGQRNKPLINTEYGILMTEGLGFDYPRVRRFMLGSFDAFLYELIDPNLGYPADDNRLIQQWFWFSLALSGFGGGDNQSGLFDPWTKNIKPLGQDYANYLAPLVQNYADLQVGPLSFMTYGPIFAGQPGMVTMEGQVTNFGNIPSPSYQARLSDSSGTLTQWSLPGLDRRYSGANTATLTHTWQHSWSNPSYQVTLALTNAGSTDPCADNNSRTGTPTSPQANTDLALLNAGSRVVQTGGGAPTVLRLHTDLVNLGRNGTGASQVTVKFWRGNPDSGGTLLHTRQLTPQTTSLPLTVSFDWQTSAYGFHDITIEVSPVPEETQLQNNRQVLRVFAPASQVFLPQAGKNATRVTSTGASDAPLQEQVVPYLMPTVEDLAGQ